MTRNLVAPPGFESITVEGIKYIGEGFEQNNVSEAAVLGLQQSS
jgi:hypothetical protein